MKSIQYQYLLIIIFFTTQLAQIATAEPAWQSNNAYLLHGNGFEVDADEQSTLTLEHASGWSMGDLFFFVDLTRFHGSDQGDGVYGELSPRLSLGKITGNHSESGLVKDVLITTTIEFGKGDVGSFLIGPGFDLNIPGFDYFSVNIYQRFIEKDRDGETIQITPVWSMSHSVWESKLTFEGYIDWNVNSDGNYHSNIHFNPRLKYDLGNFLHVEQDKIRFGFEYSYWKNKYGIKDSSNFDTNQSALSLFLNYQL